MLFVFYLNIDLIDEIRAQFFCLNALGCEHGCWADKGDTAAQRGVIRHLDTDFLAQFDQLQLSIAQVNTYLLAVFIGDGKDSLA